MSYNNTYGIQVYNRTVFDATTYLMAAPKTGCNDLIDNCRALAAQGDPTGQGLNQEANTACALATMMCWLTIQDAYSANSNVRAPHIIWPSPFLPFFLFLGGSPFDPPSLRSKCL